LQYLGDYLSDGAETWTVSGSV